MSSCFFTSHDASDVKHSVLQMSDSNKLHNLAVALLHLTVNTSLWGCGCMPIPQSGTCPRSCWEKNADFIQLAYISQTSPYKQAWGFALTCEPNPFTKAPFILNEKSHNILATGIMQLQENCPASGGNGHSHHEIWQGGLGPLWALEQVEHETDRTLKMRFSCTFSDSNQQHQLHVGINLYY